MAKMKITKKYYFRVRQSSGTGNDFFVSFNNRKIADLKKAMYMFVKIWGRVEEIIW